ncbi:hypothetical protein WA1_07435 [Scytonema hofmannii PCC 7110]|uniref:Cyanovirin-N domain-containing protein n=1 Tax=Scytonema hofmannii PCC 7110 TaxID=128403 RepID=A0A139WT89_9CYAN|nr:hypothetical protein [Scytonema hofmannii]KYC35641.1 hypothetical protein WA1_07435 [Scytonema hofmannii PCC 7110]
MQKFLLIIFLTTTGLFYICINYSLPALASVACQSGTASYHSNNSLAECILSRNTEIRVNNSYFFCKEGQPIDFTEKGIFNGCVLSESIEIRRTGEVETCPINAKVSFSISEDGNQSIVCEV